MNSKLLQLVSLGLGTIAMAVFTVSLGQGLRSSSSAAEADFDATGYALTVECCKPNSGPCAPCPPPPSRG